VSFTVLLRPIVVRDRPALDPTNDRLERVVVKRCGPCTAALAVADGDPPARGSLDGSTQARIAGAPALVEVGDEQTRSLGAAQRADPNRRSRARSREP
jgi:hypothetical protein